MRIIFTIAFAVLLATACEAQDESTSKMDQLRIAVQEICPVSGAELGSMGQPIKVNVGDEFAFLCCKECQSRKIDATHWSTIQTRIAKAQATCPIMDKPVDAKMQSTVVSGQKIFVCCPPCIEKIEADPAAAIAKVRQSFTKFIAAEKQAISDKLHAQAQGICPVSGKELGSKGEPVKVKVGSEEHAFLCCKDCVGKKLSSEHWKTIQVNLANTQAICPVMKQSVDATMKSTVVNGRRIFVCCPPCIKKIEADPEGFVSKLDEQIATQTEKLKR